MHDAIDRLRASYDAVPYESHAFSQSAPGHLAAIAHVFSLDAPAVSTARVLEIGCAAAGNLIPFAAMHPDARVVGIDLSATQIDAGRRRADLLGLNNLDLLCGDIAAIDLSTLGTFDFIVCHGVYSWVPRTVQEAILGAFDTMLGPEGVAYISYNVYPGWKAKEIVRDAMLLRGGERVEPAERLSYARGMIDFLEQVAPSDSVLAKALADYRKERSNASDYYVLHEHLEQFNEPCYFLDFGRRTEPYRLAYLADAHPQTMFARNYGEQVAGPLLEECGHSQVLVEQYLDFVANRTFRQSLLVHGERGTQIRYNLDRTRFGRLNFAAQLPPVGRSPVLDDSQQEFGEHPHNLTTRDPAVKAVLHALNAQWPWTMSRRELIDRAHVTLSAAGVTADPHLERHLDDLLEAMIIRGLVRYRLEPVTPPPSQPPFRLHEPFRRAAELALQEGISYVVNAWHEGVYVSPVDSHLLPLLDGTRDREGLVEELLTLAKNDVIRFERNGRRLSEVPELASAAAEWLDTLPLRLTLMKLY